MFGFMGRILRVNLINGEISEEPVPEKNARMFLGGSGLATKYLFDELEKGVDPLGPENKIIYMTGPLTGTISPSSGRFSAVTKSPLTVFWGEANSGGRWGRDLKRSGFDGIIIEGVAPKRVDEVLFEHPAVAMAVAIGIPDPDRPGSERVKAFVVLKDGYRETVAADEIITFCKERLAPYAVPKLVEFRENLPLTVTEKLFKRQLRDEEISKHRAAKGT